MAWAQLVNPMNVMLLLVVAASFAIVQIATALVVLGLVTFNVVMGSVQELKARASVEALARLQVPHARVRRSGQAEQIESTTLVPGDIVLLEAGDVVPADGRIVSSATLEVQEVTPPEEWKVVLEGPPIAGMIVVTAARGGTFRETIAMAKAYAEARGEHGESGLLDEIVATKPEVDHTRYHSVEELRENGFAHLRNAVAVLESEATTEELQALASAGIHPPRGEARWKADAKLV